MITSDKTAPIGIRDAKDRITLMGSTVQQASIKGELAVISKNFHLHHFKGVNFLQIQYAKKGNGSLGAYFLIGFTSFLDQ